jgi:fructokinase
MILVIGEVLIDRFPEYRRIGGAPFNFAFHLQHFGEDVRFVTRVGDDAEGRSILNHLNNCGLPINEIQVDQRYPTGRVEVRLNPEGGHTFEIKSPAAYDFVDIEHLIDRHIPAKADLIYFGSLAQRNRHGFEQIRRLLEHRSSATQCICDINLRAPFENIQVITQCLRHADILKLNDEELTFIFSHLKMDTGLTVSKNILALMDTFRIETLALTRGAQGSTAYRRKRRFDSPPPPDVEVRDTVGAGDAFAAVLALGIRHNRPMPEVLSAATNFAAGICRIPGAIPDDTEIYNAVLRQMEIS